LQVRDHLFGLDHRFRDLAFAHVPHGSARGPSDHTLSATSTQDRPRILVLGRLTAEKGLELFRAAFSALVEIADLYLVGCGDAGLEFASHEHVDVIPEYQYEDLEEIVSSIAPDAGLLLSVWPETYSYTLGELMVFGIPPVAANLGAFAERISEGHDGFLFEPSPAGLVKCVRDLMTDRQRLDSVRENLRVTEPRSLETMVADYHELMPVPPRQPARYPLQVGTRTGLTEPYRQLNEAYSQLTAAYEKRGVAMDRLQDAYNRRGKQAEQLTNAYEQRTEQVERLQMQLKQLEDAHERQTGRLERLKSAYEKSAHQIERLTRALGRRG
ncbi:MAG: glycosyltransferase, partial [Pseudomonadota bacterium]